MPVPLNNQVFYTPVLQPRRVELFMPLYEAPAVAAGVEFMQMLSPAGYAAAVYDAGMRLFQTNLRVRADLALDDWLPATATIHVFAGQAFTNGSDYKWFLGTGQAGRLNLYTKDTAGTIRIYQSDALGWVDAARWQVAVDLSRDDGAGSSVATFFRRAATLDAADGSGWTVAGTSASSAFTSLKDVQVPAFFGSLAPSPHSSSTGSFWRLLIYEGLSSENLVSDLNFDEAAPFDSGLWDDQAQLRIWTMQGGKGAAWLHSTDVPTWVADGADVEAEGGVPDWDLNPPTWVADGADVEAEGGLWVPFLPAVTTVQVSGMTHPFMAGTLRIQNRVNGRSTMSVVIRDLAAAHHFQFNQPVRVIGPDSRTLFSGWINAVSEESLVTVAGTSGGMLHEIDCKDNHYLLDKRAVFADYSDRLAGDIVRELLAGVLMEEGIVEGVVEDGAQVDLLSTSGQGKSVDQLLAELAELPDYIYRINPNRALDFRSRQYVTAPVVSYGTGMLRGSVKVKRQNLEYRNRQYSVGGPDLSTSQQTKTTTFTGDGTKKTFLLPFYPLAVTSITVNGVAQTFKEINGGTVPTAPDGTKQWYWSEITREVIQDSDSVTLTASDTLSVMYTTYLNYRVQSFIGDGVQREYETFSPVPAIHSRAATAYVDYGSGYVRELVSPFNSTGTEKWSWPSSTSTTTIFRGTAIATLPIGAKVSFIYESGAAKAVYQGDRLDEIERNKAIEGGTTSGIVERIASGDEFGGIDENVRVGEGLLNVWSHDTIELEYQTWNSQLADGEVARVVLPDHGIGPGDASEWDDNAAGAVNSWIMTGSEGTDWEWDSAGYMHVITHPARAETPDDTRFRLTGNMEVRVDLAMDDWVGAGTTGGLRKWSGSNGYRYGVTDDGKMFVSLRSGGLSSAALGSIALAWTDGERWELRWVFTADVGGGNMELKVYRRQAFTGLTNNTGWTLADTVTAAKFTSGHDTQPLMFGNANAEQNKAGKYRRALLYNASSTIVADIDFTSSVNMTNEGVEFLIHEVDIQERPTTGALDTPGSPLLYTVKATRSPEKGAAGGSFGPSRLSDVFHQLSR